MAKGPITEQQVQEYELNGFVLVRNLFDGDLAEGQSAISWDLKGFEHLNIPSGIYLIVTEGDGWRQVKKIYVVK